MFIAKHIPAFPSHHWVCCFAIEESLPWPKQNVVRAPISSGSSQNSKCYLVLWNRRILNCVKFLSWFVDVVPDKHENPQFQNLIIGASDTRLFELFCRDRLRCFSLSLSCYLQLLELLKVPVSRTSPLPFSFCVGGGCGRGEANIRWVTTKPIMVCLFDNTANGRTIG